MLLETERELLIGCQKDKLEDDFRPLLYEVSFDRLLQNLDQKAALLLEIRVENGSLR